MHKTKNTRTQTQTATPSNTPPIKEETALEGHGQSTAPFQFKPEKYRAHIAHFDMDQAQQDDLLRALWNIMTLFIDLGLGVESVQQFFPDIFKEAPKMTEETTGKSREDTHEKDRKDP